MIRPIKIFLYFFLTILLIVLIDRVMNNLNIILIPEWGTLLPTMVDTTSLPTAVLPSEIIEGDDSLSVSQDSINEKTISFPVDSDIIFINDSALIAPEQFRRLFAQFCRKAAESTKQKTVLRVLHIGDSQIEADRITETLRKKFQESYGGSGPGFIMPYDPLRINANIQLINEGEWQLSYSYHKNNYPGPLSFGFSAKAAWYWGSSASFSVSPLAWKSNRLGHFSKAKLFVATRGDSLTVQIRNNSATLSRDTLPPYKAIQTITVENLPTEEKITFEFISKHTPVFHGLTLDGESGVAVDNLAMRGRPWPGMRLAKHELLKSMADELNIGLFILQFGTNILPTRSDDYHYYYTHFIKELKILRDLFPEIPILVIGVQSAATSIDNEVKPLQRARLISNAQRSAALECGMGFIDLQRAMGGINAAVTWANQEPPLITSDYIHFSRKGAKKIGTMIWELIETLRIQINEQ